MSHRAVHPPAHQDKLAIPARLRLLRHPLQTARLTLSPISTTYADELFQSVEESRESLEQWLPWVPLTNTPDASLRYAQACERDWDNGHAARFYVHPRGERAVWGVVSLESCMRTNRSCNLGYWLHSKLRGHGLITEAAARVVDFAFQDMHAHRIVCAAGVDNKKSRNVIERLGFQFEGIARDAEWVMGRWVSHAVYSRLASDPVVSQ